MRLDNIKAGIFGVAVGDAVGVPYEFLDRKIMDKKPARDMTGFGSHNQPVGTWSDDSSLTFCLMDSLCNGYDLNDIGKKQMQWFYESLWTPHGEVFDIGITTRNAIDNFKRGMPPQFCGGEGEYANGNGSLMRILPIVFFLEKENDIEKRYEIIQEVSSLTHRHFRSVFSCFIYVEYALLLLSGKDKKEGYSELKSKIINFISKKNFDQKEVHFFSRVLEEDISKQNRSDIKGSGYVLHSLEASFWCLLNSNSYQEAVLKAVNLGEDTDTTGAITGGLAGIYYGYHNIPESWSLQLARYDDIIALIHKFNTSLQ
ncbi:ADP-ribosylglycohydrolase family protein [Aquimarina algicola]|uniref:ADP-ribosylglycohydrolase family protein n=1 Tax=Aquimarina algicola TaxID=2589995 RepID=A0A504JKQ8_9FLAO|nr:ADP-ribosylglycohydrolase family protein [Aquimarina algicola]TPN88935.1 ADP-ribosylglycohydrolase family protein [Aquimarina algicola]